MTTPQPTKVKCCQNVGCRTEASVKYRLQDGRMQWRCAGCAARARLAIKARANNLSPPPVTRH